MFGVVGVVLATSIGLVAGSLYLVVLCRRLVDLGERRLPRRWVPATASAVITAGFGELLVLRLGWHGPLPLLLAGLPVLAGLGIAWSLMARELTQAPHEPERVSVTEEAS
jgi:hypothetical protein